ncbi:MAG: hypothetical protein WD557_16145 [Dehalococcoidia bacterium]
MAHQFPSRPAPSWMQDQRGKVLMALAGALGATLAIGGIATYDALDFNDSNPPANTTNQLVPSYPASRDGVRGHVDFGPGTLGVTSDPIQPSSREPNYPASRDGLRGHVDFDPGITLGVTSDPIQPSSREPNYPASRGGVRGHVDN